MAMAVGSVVSSMVNVAFVVDALPHTSVAVKVTVAAPVAPQRSLKLVKLFVQVTLLQSSLAVAPPWLASHAASCAALPDPSHSVVVSWAAAVMDAEMWE